MLKILDHDPRVLGIEVIEDGGYNSENYWDWALSTGRQCFGFFVPDWHVENKTFGVNVLCVQEKTVHSCLKAYREGNFYGALVGLDALAFTRITFDGKTYTCGIPVNIQEPMLYYRKDKLPADWETKWDKNGNKTPDFLENWNDLYAYSKYLRDTDILLSAGTMG